MDIFYILITITIDEFVQQVHNLLICKIYMLSIQVISALSAKETLIYFEKFKRTGVFSREALINSHAVATSVWRDGVQGAIRPMADTLDKNGNAANRPPDHVPPSMFYSFSTWRLQPNRALASSTSLTS